MSSKRIVISINASWNIVNFRMPLVRGLQKEGHHVVALAPSDNWSGQLAEAGVEYHALEMDKKGVSPVRDAALFFRYLHMLRRLRPDVFLGYTAKPNIYGSLAAQLLGIKVINNVSGLGTAFVREGLLTRLVSLLYRLALKRSATIFFQNEEDRDLFVEKRLVGQNQTRLLPGSGINLERFTAIPGGNHANGFTFLFVGRLLRDKGVVEYVEAARRIRMEHPAVRFHILGFLDAENRTAVTRDQVERWVSEGAIDYLGDADDVRPYLAAADCVVLPSYREGLPRSLLEAAAMAKPLIATDVPGCRQVVLHGANGLLCRVRDAASLAEAMIEMVNAPRLLREQWGRAGRERVEREFDEKIVVQRYIEAIRDAFA